jgi:hypothetical protein
MTQIVAVLGVFVGIILLVACLILAVKKLR